MKRRSLVIGLACLCLVAIGFGARQAYMLTTTAPPTLVYNGHLLDNLGAPITAEHTIRFSLWDDKDLVAGDIAVDGSINTSATNYADWQEVHTVTPDAQGYFSVELGSINTLPSFYFEDNERELLLSLHIQVEVKLATSPNTAYEMLDIDPADDTRDRSPVLSVPFAQNADLLDQREIGTSSGDIALISEGDVFNTALIPPGTDQKFFVIDADGSESSGPLTLQFGDTINETLVFDIDDDRFEFSDDVFVDGNIIASGGVQVGNYNPQSGTGAGTIRWTGTDFEGYVGNGWKSLTAGGLFIGVTNEKTNGSFSTGALIGYQAGNHMCNIDFPGSHMCQIDEIITTIEKDLSAFTGSVNAWVIEGAPGYTSDSNDCTGWTSSGSSHLGAWWEFSLDAGQSVRDGGGVGYLTNCTLVQPVSCCM